MTALFTRSGKVLLDDGVEADTNDPMDIVGWMNERLEMEEGITFREVVRCLAPWEQVVSRIAGCDLGSIAARCEEPYPEDSSLLREDYVGIELWPSIQIDREDETQVANVSLEWNAFGRLRAPIVDMGYSSEITGLSLRHPAELVNLPIVIRRDATVVDVMTGGPAAPWDQEPVLHPTEDGKVKSFAVAPTVIGTLFCGLLEEIRHSGSDAHAGRVVASVSEALVR